MNPDLSKGYIYILISGTFIGFTIISWVALFLLNKSTNIIGLLSESSINVTWQLVLGSIPISLLAVLVFPLFLKGKSFSELIEFNIKIVKSLNPSFTQIILLAGAAGWGEELFFRGVLQPTIGLFLTSFIFAGLHVHFNFRLKLFRQYFLFTFILSLVLGLLFNLFGLITAMTAHATWDFVVLWKTRHLINKNNNKIFSIS